MARRPEHSYIFSKSVDDALLDWLLIVVVVLVFVSFCVQGARWMGWVR